MLVEIEFSMTAPKSVVIDLKDHGYEVTTKWEDLTYEEQNEITDNLSLEYDVIAGGEGLDYNTNRDYYESSYDEDELEEIKNL